LKKTLVLAIMILMIGVVAYASEGMGISITPNPFRPLLHSDLPSGRCLDQPGDRKQQGRVLAVLFTGELAAGFHSFTWNGSGEDGNRLAPGRYWVHLQGARFTSIKRVIILK
jgi:hypothetical protein